MADLWLYPGRRGSGGSAPVCLAHRDLAQTSTGSRSRPSTASPITNEYPTQAMDEPA